MNETAKKYIKDLELIPHPEGGYFREVYRSDELISKEYLPERYTGKRCFCTSIYFMLCDDNFSSFHKVKSDEIWHFYAGSPVRLSIILKDGTLNEVILGDSTSFQYTIKEGNWFAAEPVVKNSFSLVGCTVAPGFDFSDFELAERAKLTETYPQHHLIIKRFTRF